jgi:hypothetical protein
MHEIITSRMSVEKKMNVHPGFKRAVAQQVAIFHRRKNVWKGPLLYCIMNGVCLSLRKVGLVGKRNMKEFFFEEAIKLWIFIPWIWGPMKIKCRGFTRLTVSNKGIECLCAATPHNFYDLHSSLLRSTVEREKLWDYRMMEQ